MKILYQKYPVTVVFSSILAVVLLRRLMVADPEKIVIISVLLVIFLGYELFKTNISLDLDETSDKIKKEFVVYLDLKRDLLSKLKANYESLVTLNKEISYVLDLYKSKSTSITEQSKNLVNLYTNVLINNLVKEQWELIKLQNLTIYNKLFSNSDLENKLNKASLPNSFYIKSISNNTLPYTYKNDDFLLFYLDNITYDMTKTRINWAWTPHSYLPNFIYKANSPLENTVVRKLYVKKDSDLQL